MQLSNGISRSTLVFDINLDYTNTMNRLQYLVDGHYIDNATDTLSVMLITFNGALTLWRRATEAVPLPSLQTMLERAGNIVWH